MNRKGIIISFALLLLQATTAMAQTQRWWGIYTDSATPTPMGMETAETYNCAVLCSATRTILNGATVHGVRFYLRDKSLVSGVKVWLSTNRPSSADQANIQVVDVPQEQLADLDNDHRMVEVSLPSPYAISSNIYVGYSFTVSSAATASGKQPVISSGRGNGATGSFYLRTSKTLPSWNDVSSQYGALALQLLVSNPSLAVNAVQPQALGRMVSVAGSNAETEVTLSSSGLAEVRSIDYVVTVGSEVLAETHYDLPASIWGPGNTATIPINFTAPTQASRQTYAVAVTKVNGAANEAPRSQASNQLITVDRLATRRSVVEEYTGTWCTNCPRGTVGMENLSRDFGDRFVGIAVHSNDPMALSAYQPLVPSGIPRCSMDRTVQCDPYMGLVSDYHYHAGEAFQLLLSQPSEADVTLTACWADADQTAISYQALTTFYMNADQADYALAFILTADGLRGTTSDWHQVNGESGRNTYPDEDMARFRNAPDPVVDIEYNHVAVAIEGITTGMAGSIASPIVSGQAQAFSRTYSLLGNRLIQDKSRLQANVLLLNTTTGQVVNAAKCAIAAYDPAAVPSVAIVSQPTERWATLSGQRIAAPTRPGLYIHNGRKIIINK